VSGTRLYRRLLGPDFDRLPRGLRAFHDSAAGEVGAGLVRVRGGAGLAARCLARALGLPRAGEHVEVTLRVRVVGEREIWERVFDGRRLRTTQWVEGGRLVERVRGATFVFDVDASEDGMRFRSSAFRWLGVPLPPALALRVDADVVGLDGGWTVAVAVRAPRLGVITSYAGRITPRQEGATSATLTTTRAAGALPT
jgi:hypothetical protein